MNNLISISGTHLFGIKKSFQHKLDQPIQFNDYSLIIIKEGEGFFHSDFGIFNYKGPAILFATPMQTIYLQQLVNTEFTLLQFHSDFYCIAYHHAEVACNGLLFNNIYLSPTLYLAPEEFKNFELLLGQIEQELLQPAPSDIVVKSYLQVLLAKSSQVKNRELNENTNQATPDEQMETFKHLVEKHFLTIRKVSDYAKLLSMSPSNLTKRSIKHYQKKPSNIIIERLILEAKKQLHLTRKSSKEIAYALNFDDESYFGRVFKKYTNETPQSFRDKVGISIVANMYQ